MSPSSRFLFSHTFLFFIFVFFVLLWLCAPILETAQEASYKATEPTLKATQPQKTLNNHYK
jgi:hypothetical protein